DDHQPAFAAADVDDAVGAVADQHRVAALHLHRILAVGGDLEGPGDDVDEELVMVEHLAHRLFALADVDRPARLVLADPRLQLPARVAEELGDDPLVARVEHAALALADDLDRAPADPAALDQVAEL